VQRNGLLRAALAVLRAVGAVSSPARSQDSAAPWSAASGATWWRPNSSRRLRRTDSRWHS